MEFLKKSKYNDLSVILIVMAIIFQLTFVGTPKDRDKMSQTATKYEQLTTKASSMLIVSYVFAFFGLISWAVSLYRKEMLRFL